VVLLVVVGLQTRQSGARLVPEKVEGRESEGHLLAYSTSLGEVRVRFGDDVLWGRDEAHCIVSQSPEDDTPAPSEVLATGTVTLLPFESETIPVPSGAEATGFLIDYNFLDGTAPKCRLQVSPMPVVPLMGYHPDFLPPSFDLPNTRRVVYCPSRFDSIRPILEFDANLVLVCGTEETFSSFSFEIRTTVNSIIPEDTTSPDPDVGTSGANPYTDFPSISGIKIDPLLKAGQPHFYLIDVCVRLSIHLEATCDPLFPSQVSQLLGVGSFMTVNQSVLLKGVSLQTDGEQDVFSVCPGESSPTLLVIIPYIKGSCRYTTVVRANSTSVAVRPIGEIANLDFQHFMRNSFRIADTGTLWTSLVENYFGEPVPHNNVPILEILLRGSVVGEIGDVAVSIPVTETGAGPLYPVFPQLITIHPLIYANISNTITFNTNRSSDTLHVVFLKRAGTLVYFSDGLPNGIQLSALSRFAAADGRAPVGEAWVPDQWVTSCDITAFQMMENVIRKAGQQLLTVRDGSHRRSLSYGVSTLASTAVAEACLKFAMDFHVRSEERFRTSFTNGCPTSVLEESADPCCERTSSLDQCCVERTLPVEDVVFNQVLENMTRTCLQPACAPIFSSDVGTVDRRIRNELNCYEFPPSGDIFAYEAEEDSLHFFQSCKRDILGYDFWGYPCESDEDCLRQFGIGVCDTAAEAGVLSLRGRCFGVRSVMEDQFLECLVERMSPKFRTELLKLLDRRTLTAADLRNVSLARNCVGEYGPGGPRGLRFERTGLFLSCLACLGEYCFDRTNCRDIVACPVEKSGYLCEYELQRVAPVFRDCEKSVCNYGSGFEAKCTNGVEFCGYCHNSSNCVVFFDIESPEDIELCAATVACTLSSGETVATMSLAECQALGSASEMELCRDFEEIAHQVDLAAEVFPSLEGARAGVCLTQSVMPDVGTPDCGLFEVAEDAIRFNLNFLTNRGCANFSTCALDFRTVSCEHVLSSRGECEGKGYRWLPLPVPIGECGVLESCRVAETRNLGRPYDVATCAYCGGIQTSASELVTRPEALARPAQLVLSRFVSLDKAGNFMSTQELYTLFAQVLENVRTELFIVDYLCRYDALLRGLGGFLCACLESGESCYNEESLFVSTEFCEGIEGSLDIIFGMISANESAVDGGAIVSQNPPCLSCVVREVDKTFFTARTTFFRESFFSSRSPTDVVVNDNGASVGTVVGNGLFLNISSDFVEADRVALRHVEVCFLTEYMDLLDIPEAYTVLDIGIADVEESLLGIKSGGQSRVSPLGVSFPLLAEVVCGTVESPLAETSVFLPIVRRPDFSNTITSNDFTTGEKVALSVVAGLYGVTFLAIAIILVITLRYNFAWTNVVMLSLLAGLMLLRVVYLALSAASELTIREGQVADIAFLDAGAILYLGAAGVLTMTFLYFVRATSRGRHDFSIRLKYWAVWGSWFGFLLAVFTAVVLIILFMDTSDNVVISCGGRVTSLEENNSADYIRAGLHGFVLVNSLGLLLLLYAVGIYTYSLVREARQTRLVVLVLVAGFGVTASSCMYMVYYLVDDPSAYISIVMFVLEGVPSFVIAVLVRTRKVQKLRAARRAGGNRSQNRRAARVTIRDTEMESMT